MIAAFVADLIFASRVEAVAAQRGAAVTVLRQAADVLAQLDRWHAVLVDLSVDQAAALVPELKRRRPELRVVGFFPHVRADLKQAAKAAGADQVLTRAQFVERLPALLAE